jgi:hypothetical protein
MKPIDYVLIAAVALFVLVGCGQVQEARVESLPPSEASKGATSSGRGVDSATGLALGTLKLEDTKSALTPTQAAELLPLWQMIASGSLKSETETDAVLKQIEGMMSGPQLAAINTMELEGGDVQTWMREQGIDIPALPTGQGNGNGPGALQNLSEEDRAKMREEFQNMTAEERFTRMAELGIERPEGGAGARPSGGMGPSNALFGYLVEHLAERAAG